MDLDTKVDEQLSRVQRRLDDSIASIGHRIDGEVTALERGAADAEVASCLSRAADRAAIQQLERSTAERAQALAGALQESESRLGARLEARLPIAPPYRPLNPILCHARRGFTLFAVLYHNFRNTRDKVRTEMRLLMF